MIDNPLVLNCSKCGWVWMKRRGEHGEEKPDPDTCPNPKCRTRNWRPSESEPARTLDYTEGQ